ISMISVGIVLLLYNLTLTQINNIKGLLIIAGLTSIWCIVFLGISTFIPKILTKINASIIIAHLFDASSTFTALTFFGFKEQHVVPTFLFNLFKGPWIFFPTKIIVVWSVLYLIDKYSDDKFFNNFLKIVILILGLALGIRDFLTVSMLPYFL
ncbi:MAG: DUF63 family protein, partial [Candidatus Aenigmarchaeota archaeon]|nr:DUF63 family protein [Candidatus Aenigmarchaeota archaeon]